MSDAGVTGIQAQSVIQSAVGTAIAVTLAIALLALGACTPVRNSSSLTAQAAHYGVSPKLLYAAENRGYWPRTRGGETVFCHSSEVTGSYIAAQECLDPARLQTRLSQEEREQLQDQQALQRSHAECPPTTAC
jgi:hypothetical protein